MKDKRKRESYDHSDSNNKEDDKNEHIHKRKKNTDELSEMLENLSLVHNNRIKEELSRSNKRIIELTKELKKANREIIELKSSLDVTLTLLTMERNKNKKK